MTAPVLTDAQVEDLYELACRDWNEATSAFPSVGVFLARRIFAALSASRQEGWISVDERLPGPGVIVLAFFRNSYGKGRVVRAHHAPKHTIEAGHWDEDAETDNTDDGSFEPEGWYEDPAVGETLSFISPESDGAVSHWRPMPAAPQESQGDRHGE
jgi:hypothetical protein